MNIIGIDQSLTSTGITVHKLNEYNDITNTTHYFSTTVAKMQEIRCDEITPWFIGKCKDFEKIKRICERIEFLFIELNPTHVALEGYAFGATGRSVFQSGELGGVIKWLCSKYNIPLFIYEPTTVKKFATGKGKGKKGPMYKAYVEKYDDGKVMTYYDSINRKLPLDTQLDKVAGKPLCDLIDSHFIADLLHSEING